MRTLHEVFEADRRGLIQSISLEVGTETVDPATGIEGYVPFVAVAAERDTFMAFDLSEVVPAATLEHLGAAVSKNPLGLVPADVSEIRKAHEQSAPVQPPAGLANTAAGLAAAGGLDTGPVLAGSAGRLAVVGPRRRRRHPQRPRAG